jgi:hypothetical protein
VGTWDGTFRAGTLRLLMQAGVERVTNLGFDDGVGDNGGLARVMVELRPGRR